MTTYRPLIVLSTASSPEEAGRIAQHLVESRLAACVSMVEKVQSVYRWQETIETATETMMIIKTSDSHVEAVEAAIRELHSYETPEILALPVSSGSDDYLRWLLQSLS